MAQFEKASINSRSGHAIAHGQCKTRSLLLPLGSHGSVKPSFVHVFDFHVKFALPILRGDRKLVPKVIEWLASQPLNVQTYLGPGTSVNIKKLWNIQAKLMVYYKKSGSPPDMEAWLASCLTPALKSHSDLMVGS